MYKNIYYVKEYVAIPALFYDNQYTFLFKMYFYNKNYRNTVNSLKFLK